jgi:hypothetical protein
MEYKYPPIYKYIILLICIFLFIKHLKIMVVQQNLMITIPIIIIVMIFDYILIDNHTDLLGSSTENFLSPENVGDTITNEEIDEILKNYNPEDMEKELDDDEQLEYPNYTEKAFYQMPTDYRQPSYDLDVDCYRRGDGRGNSAPIDRYYSQDILGVSRMDS